MKGLQQSCQQHSECDYLKAAGTVTPQRRWGLQQTHAPRATESSAYRDQTVLASTKSFKNFGPWPTELRLPAVRTKRCNIPRAMHHHHLSPSSALQPLQRAEPQLPLLCLTSQAPATHRRVEKLPLSPSVPRNRLHEARRLTALSSPKKGAPSWWGDFLLPSHCQRRSIPGRHFKDKAAL